MLFILQLVVAVCEHGGTSLTCLPWTLQLLAPIVQSVLEAGVAGDHPVPAAAHHVAGVGDVERLAAERWRT